MRRFFGRKENNNIILEESESYHLQKVLRMKEGERLIACVNDDYDYYCTIKEINKHNVLLEIESKEPCKALPKRNIVLFQMIPKKEYFDQILPKAIELGVSQIHFFTSANTQTKGLKQERVNSQVMTASKQCERSRLIDVDLIDFKQTLKILKEFDVIIFANEHDTSNKFDINFVKNKQNIAVIIGNEGGFTVDEASQIIMAGGKSFSLGSRILRCDTAVVSTLTLVGIFSDN